LVAWSASRVVAWSCQGASDDERHTGRNVLKPSNEYPGNEVTGGAAAPIPLAGRGGWSRGCPVTWLPRSVCGPRRWRLQKAFSRNAPIPSNHAQSNEVTGGAAALIPLAGRGGLGDTFAPAGGFRWKRLNPLSGAWGFGSSLIVLSLCGVIGLNPLRAYPKKHERVEKDGVTC